MDLKFLFFAGDRSTSACNITQRADNGLLKPDDVTRASAGGDITDEFVGERAPNWFLALIWNGYLSRYTRS
jgi:hypothetical protein